MRKQHRRYFVCFYSCFFQFFIVCFYMIQVHLTKFYVFVFCSCFFTCISAEYDDIEQRVTHQSVGSVDSACCLSCNQKVRGFFCKSVSCDLQSTVLIMKSRVDHDRYFSHINAIVHVHTEHSRDSLFDGSLTAEDLDHRSIQPYTFCSARNFYTTSFAALTDNTGSVDITSFQRMDVSFSVCINQLCTYGTNFFCYQSTQDL